MISISRRATGLLSGSGLLAATLLTAGGSAAAVTSATGAGPIPLARLASTVSFLKPPTTADCVAQIGIPCYAPFQYQKAYDLAPLYAKGFTGKGETIVIVDFVRVQRHSERIDDVRQLRSGFLHLLTSM